jgi:probable F420-dependent oxidoreductase
VKFWQAVSFTETDQVVEVAKLAEELGFCGVMVSDHVFHPGRLVSRYPFSADGKPDFTADTDFPEPWSLIGAMASVTRTLRFTTGVYILPLRHPLEVAKATATLSVLSGGRLALGAGLGWMQEEYAQLGRDFRTRGRRCDEMIDVLRKVWRGGMVEHHGEFYDFDPLQLSPAAAGPIPIYIGGASPAALRRAGRLGERHRRRARRPGRDPVPPSGRRPRRSPLRGAGPLDQPTGPRPLPPPRRRRRHVDRALPAGLRARPALDARAEARGHGALRERRDREAALIGRVPARRRSRGRGRT